MSGCGGAEGPAPGWAIGRRGATALALILAPLAVGRPAEAGSIGAVEQGGIEISYGRGAYVDRVGDPLVGTTLFFPPGEAIIDYFAFLLFDLSGQPALSSLALDGSFPFLSDYYGVSLPGPPGLRLEAEVRVLSQSAVEFIDAPGYAYMVYSEISSAPVAGRFAVENPSSAADQDLLSFRVEFDSWVVDAANAARLAGNRFGLALTPDWSTVSAEDVRLGAGSALARLSSPAFAGGSVVPEPSSLAMATAAVAMLGAAAAMRRPRARSRRTNGASS